MTQVPLAPPPPTNQPIFDRWAWLLWKRLTATGQLLWDGLSFVGSNLTDIETRNHNDLQNLDAGDYVHLTAANHTDLTDGGATTLHKHDHGGMDGLGDDDHTQYVLASGARNITGQQKFEDNIVLPKTSGKGILVDPTTPTFGWRDILGPIEIKAIGATDPVWAVYRGSIYAYTFDSATAEAFFTFHIPHDYVPGSDMYIHMHWSQNVVDTGGTAGVPGAVEWNFDISYADGHGTAGGAADPFVAPITVTVVQQGSTTQYGHMIAEVQFSNSGGTGGLLDSGTIVVDGLLLVKAYRIKANAADTLNQAPFGHTCDIHYQSTNMATKNKSPNFYS